MRGVVMHSAGDVRVEAREDPKIIEATCRTAQRTALVLNSSNPASANAGRGCQHPPVELKSRALVA